MKSIPGIILLMVAAATLQAQNFSIQSLDWVVVETENLKNAERTNYACSFVSSIAEVKWLQKNGTRTTTFKVVSTNGTWADVMQEGSMTLNVTRGTDEGMIIFSRKEGQTTITLDFSASGTHAIRQKFFVSSVQPHN